MTNIIHKLTLSKVCTIAYQAQQIAAKKNIQLSQSDAMRQAWDLVRTTNCFVLEFERQSGKKKGQLARKVLCTDLTAFYQFKGKTHYPNSDKTYKKDGLTAYIDLARVVAQPQFPIVKIWDHSIKTRDQLAA